MFWDYTPLIHVLESSNQLPQRLWNPHKNPVFLSLVNFLSTVYTDHQHPVHNAKSKSYHNYTSKLKIQYCELNFIFRQSIQKLMYNFLLTLLFSQNMV